MVVELLELGVEPVREGRVDTLDRLDLAGRRIADPVAARGGAAAAGLVRNSQGDALVERRSHQRGLAQARMADHGDPLLVQLVHLDQIIDHALDTPGPEGDGAGLFFRVEQLPERAAGFLAVGIDLAVVEGCHRVTALDGLIQRPGILVLAAIGRGRPVVLDAGTGVHPHGRNVDGGIIDQGVVACEVHAHEDRSRSLALGGDDEQHVNFRSRQGRERETDLAEDRLAVQCLRVLMLDLRLYRRGGWKLAIHVVLEEPFQLRPALLFPLLGASDPVAVEHHQRIGQLPVRGHLVGRRQIGRGRTASQKEEKEKGGKDQLHEQAP